MSDAAAAVILAQVRAKLDGVVYARHGILTCGGTWAPDGVGYASDTVARADPTLVFEIVVPGPQSFGPVGGGAINAPSYAQSVATQYANGIAILRDRFGRGLTSGVWGYSQGGEVAARLAMACKTGELAQYSELFIGGGTYGGPCRLADLGAPNYPVQKGSHGISPVNMTEADIQYVDGQLAWGDYANPHDLYTTSPKGQVGVIEADAYTVATALQFNDMLAFVEAEVNACLKTLSDALGESGTGGLIGSLLSGGIVVALATLGVSAVTGILTGLLEGPQANATGVQAAAEAAINGIEFIAANPPTAPHISYEGENGYPDAVGLGAEFLNHIALLTPATI